jgi:tight adherence protein C
MILILLLGIVLVGIAAALAGRAVVIHRLRAVETVGQIGAYGFTPTTHAPNTRLVADAAAIPGVDLRKGVGNILRSLGNFVGRRLSGKRQEELQRLLSSAGMYTTSPAKIRGAQALGLVILPILWLWVTISGGASGVTIVFGTVVTVVIGWFGPMMIVKRRARLRLEQIDREMPDLIDTLVISVEAGIAFSGSVQLAARRFRGALADEVRLMLQEQNMGLPLTEALAHMLERVDTPSVRSFVRSITQGELLGVSSAQTLRGLATEMRKRRRQAAEERAHKAPVKIVFPLVLLILPVLFFIILGPSLIRIHEVIR